MARARENPVGFASEYDKICYRHSAQVTADANEFTEQDAITYVNVVDPIESWKNPNRWVGRPFYSHQINKCKREGMPCTRLQELVFKWINTYAASRPVGAPAFICHTRRSTGNDKRLHTKGEIITAWQKQVVAASPPANQECYPQQPADSAVKSLEGKCYRVRVPQNSTYLVVDERMEVLFPTGCTFRVVEDEIAGKDVEVEMIQQSASSQGQTFWGHVDHDQGVDQWWNGTIQLLRKTCANGLWAAANLELVDKTTISLVTDKADADVDKEHVRRNIGGATIVYFHPEEDFRDDSVFGSRSDQLQMELDQRLITYPPDADRNETRKNAWKATGGLDFVTAFNLNLEERTVEYTHIHVVHWINSKVFSNDAFKTKVLFTSPNSTFEWRPMDAFPKEIGAKAFRAYRPDQCLWAMYVGHGLTNDEAIDYVTKIRDHKHRTGGVCYLWKVPVSLRNGIGELPPGLRFRTGEDTLDNHQLHPNPLPNGRMEDMLFLGGPPPTDCFVACFNDKGNKSPPFKIDLPPEMQYMLDVKGSDPSAAVQYLTLPPIKRPLDLLVATNSRGRLDQWYILTKPRITQFITLAELRSELKEDLEPSTHSEFYDIIEYYHAVKAGAFRQNDGSLELFIREHEPLDERNLLGSAQRLLGWLHQTAEEQPAKKKRGKGITTGTFVDLCVAHFAHTIA